ncbi:MAG: hypothetical protein CME68_03655 [Halobacteriovoraceae bacterium]|nr:hypothetical protein [Halobacteriovoraceae bacterium]
METKIENENSTEDLQETKKPVKKDKEKVIEEKGPKEIKTKALFSTLPDHPLSKFQNEIKKRNIKDVNLNNILLEAIDQLPPKWWEDKVELLTPLEYKVQEALKKPDMREKLENLLVEGQRREESEQQKNNQ